MSSTRRIRQLLATALVATATVAGAAACDDGKSGDNGGRQTAASSATSAAAVAPPSPAELTALLDKASDPAVPTDQKVDLVQGGHEAPELFDQIAKLKQEKNATIQIADASDGDAPGTALANAVIKQPGQQDINVQAKFIKEGENWKLQKSFACALITNAGLQAPPTCAGQ